MDQDGFSQQTWGSRRTVIGRMADIDEEEALVDKCLISWGEVSVDSHGWGWGWSTMSSKTLETRSEF